MVTIVHNLYLVTCFIQRGTEILLLIS